MDELISKQALLDALRARFGVDVDHGKWWSSTNVLAAIESVPGVRSQEPKYCDRNICVKNEHNGIGCDECEVTKSQEPCEDAISRQAVLDIWHTSYSDNREENEEIQYKKIAFELPSVKPQYTDAEIQKMQELEQAEIEKAYELGKEAAKVQKTGHWEEVQFRTIPYNRISKARKCSVCGKRKDKGVIWNYCPNCGVRMVEPQERSE